MAKKKLILTLVVVFIATIALALAGQKATDGQLADTRAVTMQGKLVCLGCSLKAEGANSACKDLGCSHALQTEDGKYISFLENAQSQELIHGTSAHNRNIEVTGTFFAKANVIDVESYKIENDKKISWCSRCDKMDGCAAYAEADHSGHNH